MLCSLKRKCTIRYVSAFAALIDVSLASKLWKGKEKRCWSALESMNYGMLLLRAVDVYNVPHKINRIFCRLLLMGLWVTQKCTCCAELLVPVLILREHTMAGRLILGGESKLIPSLGQKTDSSQPRTFPCLVRATSLFLNHCKNPPETFLNQPKVLTVPNAAMWLWKQWLAVTVLSCQFGPAPMRRTVCMRLVWKADRYCTEGHILKFLAPEGSVAYLDQHAPVSVTQCAVIHREKGFGMADIQAPLKFWSEYEPSTPRLLFPSLPDKTLIMPTCIN